MAESKAAAGVSDLRHDSLLSMAVFAEGTAYFPVPEAFKGQKESGHGQARGAAQKHPCRLRDVLCGIVTIFATQTEVHKQLQHSVARAKAIEPAELPRQTPDPGPGVKCLSGAISGTEGGCEGG